MFALINFISYIAASLFSVFFYVRSVSPAQRERKMGEEAYAQCAQDRVISTVLMLLALATFVLCRKFPITRSLSMRFGWPAWLSIVFAVILGLPALTLTIMGLQEAGAETIAPRKETKLYSTGIYTHIRHPQASEALLWPALALGLNSPLLLLLSLPWLLLEIIMVMAEDTDLVIRFGEPYLKYRENTGAFIPLDWLEKENMKQVVEKIKELFDKG